MGPRRLCPRRRRRRPRTEQAPVQQLVVQALGGQHLLRARQQAQLVHRRLAGLVVAHVLLHRHLHLRQEGLHLRLGLGLPALGVAAAALGEEAVQLVLGVLLRRLLRLLKPQLQGHRGRGGGEARVPS